MLIAQPRPWTSTHNREIGDANGNVVQYTQATLGTICLCVNSYDRLVSALAQIDDWLGEDRSSRTSDDEMRAAVREAIGIIGCEQLAVMIETLEAPSADLDRRVATELRIPEAPYTSSVDAAMSLVPEGWKFSVGSSSVVNQATGETKMSMSITVFDDKRSVQASNANIACALTAAALRAVELSR